MPSLELGVWSLRHKSSLRFETKIRNLKVKFDQKEKGSTLIRYCETKTFLKLLKTKAAFLKIDINLNV
jgi:hypothetical protein